MRFYLKTLYESKTSSSLFGPMKTLLLPACVAIVAENGSRLHVASSNASVFTRHSVNFDQIPPRSLWVKPAVMADQIEHFIKTNTAGEKIEFFGLNCAYDFVAFASLWGGVGDYGYDRTDFPETIFDVTQTLIQFLEFLPDEFFHAYDLTNIRDKKDGEYYTSKERTTLFYSMADCPQKTMSGILGEAIWTAELDAFIRNQKADYLSDKFNDRDDE